MKIEKSNITLFPYDGKIVINSIVRYREDKDFSFGKVLEINDKSVKIKDLSNNIILFKELKQLKLHKYYVIIKKNIIGELSFNDYDYVSNNNIKSLEIKIKTIFMKPEIGDEVMITCPTLVNLAKWRGRKEKGRIIDIKNRRAIIQLYNNEVVNKSRHSYSLVSKPNKKNICYLIK